VQPGVDPGPTKQLAGWHGRDWTYNRAFVDGHAEVQKVYDEGTEDRDGYALHYRNEPLDTYPPWLDGEDGSFGMYQCVLVRGDGWQKDTLPSPPLRTGLASPYPGRPSYEGCVTATQGASQ
jgi:prepilin-type processing-associated H-X9-DG protein